MNRSEARVQKWQTQPLDANQPSTKVKVRVRKRPWITKGEKIIYSIVGIAFIVMCYYFVSFSSKADQLNRDIQSVEEKIAEQEMKNEGLLYEVKELSKPDRIKAIAEEHGLKIQETKVKKAEAINE